MKTIEIIGVLGSCIVAISFIPQTYKIIKNNDVHSISSSFIMINILSSSLLIYYGVYYFIIPMMIANLSVCFNNIIILYYIYHN